MTTFLEFFACRKTWVTVALIVAGAATVSADFSCETRIGRPGKTEPSISRTYMSESAIRLEPGGGIVQIINFTTRELLEMNLNDKTYRVTRFDDLVVPATGDKAKPEAQSKDMLSRMVDSMEVTRTEETQVINGHKCTKHLVSVMGGSPSEYWITSEIPEYGLQLAKADKLREIFRNHAVLATLTNSYDSYQKLGGFSLKTINHLMGMDLVSEVVNISTEPVDAKIFQIPEGFSKK